MRNKQYLLKFVLILSGLLQTNLTGEEAFLAASWESSTVQPDRKIMTNSDGATVQTKPDGTKIIKTLDNTFIQINPDGSKIIKKSDGTIIQIKSDGSRIIKTPDGSIFEE